MDIARRWLSSVVVQALLIALVSRIAITFAMFYSLVTIPSLAESQGRGPFSQAPDKPWIGGWTLWDSAIYAEIAQFGYRDPSEQWLMTRAFFPLYPLATRLMVFVSPIPATNEGYAIAGVLVSQVFFLLAVVLFARMVSEKFGHSIARTSTLLLCVSPMSFFFSAGYTESLFLVLVVLAFAQGYKDRWYFVAFVVMLAGLTRITSVFLMPAILLLAWERRAKWRELAALAIVMPLGTFAFFTYFWWKYDNFFLYFDTVAELWPGWEGRTGQYIRLAVTSPGDLISQIDGITILLNLGISSLWLLSLYWVWKYLDAGMALFTTLVVLFHFATTWHSIGRYMLPAIGFYIVAAMLLERPGWNTWFRELVVFVSAVLLVTLTILHTHAVWII